RAPGGWEVFALAVRAVLGQQETVTGARRLAERLVATCGEELPAAARASSDSLTHAFPSPERVAAADLAALGVPAARRDALTAIAGAAIADPNLFRPLATVDEALSRLRAIPGIGEWTAQYIALRALRESDAFPASDVGLLRGAARRTGGRPTTAALLKRAERWRPWRAYAAQHLWTCDAAGEPSATERVAAGSPEKESFVKSFALGLRFRDLHRSGTLVLPNAWDAASAAIAAAAGAEAVATTSSGISWSLGVPDGEQLSRADMIDVVARVARSVDVPVSADVEAGYGPVPSDVAATIAAVIDAGAVGANLEDRLRTDDGPLWPIARQCERLAAARDAADRSGVAFVLNARTDVFLAAVGDPADREGMVLERAEAYRRAGADCLFVPGLVDLDAIARLVRAS